jgi:hypothetical protein
VVEFWAVEFLAVAAYFTVVVRAAEVSAVVVATADLCVALLPADPLAVLWQIVTAAIASLAD